MKKKTDKARIAELEKRVNDLERNRVIIVPVPSPMTAPVIVPDTNAWPTWPRRSPASPWAPWHPSLYEITCIGPVLSSETVKVTC